MSLRNECATTWFLNGALPIDGVLRIVAEYGSGFEGVPVFTLENGATPIAMVEIPVGKLATSADRVVKIWDVANQTCVQTLGHQAVVYSLALLPDNKLASGSHDCTVRVWNLDNGQLIWQLSTHNDWATNLVVLPDNLLASSGFYNPIRIWNHHTGACVNTLEGYTAVCMLGMDARLVFGNEHGEIGVWDNASNAHSRLIGHRGAVYTMVRLSTDTLASGASDRTVRIWNVNTGDCLQTLEGHHRAVHVLISLPGGALASASDEVHMWNVADGACVKTLKASVKNPKAFNPFDFHQGGMKVVPTPDNKECFFNLAQLRNGYLVALCRNGTACVWDTEKGTLVYREESEEFTRELFVTMASLSAGALCAIPRGSYILIYE